MVDPKRSRAEHTRRGVIFLLGAGASRDAGLPVTRDFFSYLRRGFEGSWENEQERSGVERGQRLLTLVQETMRTARSPFADPDNFEDVMRAIDELRFRHRQKTYPFVSSWNDALREFQGNPFWGTAGGLEWLPRESLESDAQFALLQIWADKEVPSEGHTYDWLYHRVQLSLRDWLSIDGRDVSYLAKLADFGQSVQVFTLNYDLGIEQACADAGVRWTTGFTPEGDWEPASLDADDYRLRLYKLHGSVSWYRRSLGNGFFDISEHPLTEWDKIYAQETAARDDMETLYDTQPHPMLFARGHQLPGYEPYVSLFSRFLEAIHEAKWLVVIGCRWDTNSLFRDAISREGHLGLRAITVTGPGAPAGEFTLTCGAKNALEDGVLSRMYDESAKRLCRERRERSEAMEPILNALRAQEEYITRQIREAKNKRNP